MRIAFDHQIFSCQAFGGIARYFCCLARRLAGMDHLDVSIVAPDYVTEGLDDLPSGLVHGRRLPFDRAGVAELLRQNLSSVRAILKSTSPDLVHETYYTNAEATWAGVPTVTTVHDMIHEKFPRLCHPGDRTAHYKALALERADHVICNSESTRRDLLEISGISEERATVVHLGVEPLGKGDAEAVSSPVARPCILFVGHRGGYKNFEALISAYAISSRLRKDCVILCVGGDPVSSVERAQWAALGVGEERIIHRGCRDGELAACYRNSALLVYPSLYEGFGLPVLEAMLHGCPVACSNSSSLPEVAGDAAHFFDPSDVEEMSDAIERVVFSDEYRRDLVARGMQRARRFTWEACAAGTVEVYTSVLEDP